ncbi:MAG: hypothetical protein C4542_04115 [Dehalococcoidia bacterium]|nr:MAG: hypothetical protein C4542_04115 [Dehalococcoidia bacterium]
MVGYKRKSKTGAKQKARQRPLERHNASILARDIEGVNTSAISYRLSAISYRLSAIGFQLSAISFQLSADC